MTQVSTGENDSDTRVEQMQHRSLGFVCGPFRGSQLYWPTVDTKTFGMVEWVMPKV